MEELRDRNGLTEAEFLASYDASKYERPSVTVDIIIIKQNRVLLIKRGGHPCIGRLAFPGGFVDMNENVYTAAARELMEETGLKAKLLRQLPVASEPKRDPRTRIISVPFIADIEDESALNAGDDAMSAQWYDFSYKTVKVNDTAFMEIFINDDGNRLSFKVARGTDKSGLIGDYIFKPMGNKVMAGDHGELFACAIDYLYGVEF